jgi:thymidine kinase
MAELVFFSGTMDSGKSTLALQMDHNYAARGRTGLIFTRDDRAGAARLSSRLGLEVDAREVGDDTDFWAVVAAERQAGRLIDYLVCDEAQFYSPAQIEQLARLVDEIEIDVFAFGITADFRTRLFPGSARLIELADRIEVLQVQTLCWCGARATHNARTVGGVMVIEGDQVVIGDVDGGEIAYEVLCRRHHMRRMTAEVARRRSSSDAGLLDLDTHDGELPGEPPLGRRR